MTAILGLSAFYHDSAAALIIDGEIVAAAQEERFSRKKHDERFPQQAVDFCLKQAGLTPAELALMLGDPGAARPMGRSELQALISAWPDGRKEEGNGGR